MGIVTTGRQACLKVRSAWFRPGRLLGSFMVFVVWCHMSWGETPTLFNESPSQANFQAAQDVGLANIFTSCSSFTVALSSALSAGASSSMMDVKSALVGVACDAIANGISIATVCPGSDNAQNMGVAGLMAMMGSMNGAMGFMGANGVNPGVMGNMTDICQLLGDPNMDNMMQAQLSMALCNNACKMGKIQAIQGELNCLGNQSALLKQELGTLTQTYQANIQKFQTDVQTIRSAEDDRTQQIANVVEKLGGDSERGGKPGLIALQAQSEQLLAAMPSTLQAQKNAYQKVVQDQNVLDNQIQMSEAAQMMDCFANRTVDSYRCSPNGPPETPKNYLQCRYQQNLLLGKNGDVTQYDATTKQSQASGDALTATLNELVADAPNMTSLPSNQAQTDAAAQQSVLILSAADVQNRYGALLSKYRIGGTNAEDFVMSLMQSCQSRAAATVAQQEQMASSTIGKQAYQIRQDQQTVVQANNQLLNAYNQQYAADMSGLTGQSIPLNTGACMNAPITTQLNCLQSFQTNMQNLLFGNGPSSAMQIQLQGNNPTTYVNFTCQGINGCVTALQNAKQNLTSDKNQLTQSRKNYVLSAFQSTEAETKKVAASVSVQSQFLSQQELGINAALTSLGQTGMNFPNVQGEKLQKDPETGLPMQPDNVYNLIAQYVNPPLPDMSSASSQASGLSAAETQAEQNNAQINQQLIMAKQLPIMCAAQKTQKAIGDIFNSLDNRAADAAQGGCYSDRYCDNGKEDSTKQTLQDALTALQGKASQSGVSSVDFASLQDGIDNFCEGKHTTGQQNRSRCQSFYSGLVNAKAKLGALEATPTTGTSVLGF